MSVCWSMPTYIAYRVAELEGSSSNNCTAGAAYNLLSRCVIAVSLVTLAAVSLDRYIALHLHLSYKRNHYNQADCYFPGQRLGGVRFCVGTLVDT